MKRILHAAVFLIFSSLFLNTLYAQEILEGDSIYVEALHKRPIPKLSSTAAKYDIDLQKIPLSAGVVNNALNRNQNNSNLGDALKNISGVNTQTGFGVHDYFIIRGLNSLDNSLILTDGTPEPEVTYYNLYNVERVELLKGPGAFLYGSNPLSGTVNIVRKQPLFKNFINVHTAAGQFAGYRGSVDAGLSSLESGIASRINVFYEQADNYRDDKKNSVLAVNPAVMWSSKNGHAFNLNLEFINSKYKPDTGLPLLYDPAAQQLNKIPDISAKTSFQTPFDFSDQKIVRAKLNYNKDFNDMISLQSRLYYSRLDWNSKGTLINGAFPAQDGSLSVNRSMSDLEDIRNLIGAQNEIIISFSTGSVEHKLLAGFELSRLQEDYTYDIAPMIPAIDLANPVETAAADQIIMFPYLKGDVINQTAAPYFMDRMTYSEQLQVTAGLRYDFITFENRAAGYQTRREFDNLSPLLGISYSPVKCITLYGNSSRAYAPPSSQVVGKLNAEKSRQYEIGLKQRYFNGLVNLDLAYYDLKKDNISIPAADGISRESGSQQSKGIELDLSAEPLQKWFTFLSYTYSDVELTKFSEKVTVGQDQYGQPIEMVFDRSGKVPAFSPKHMLNFWTTKEFDNGLGLGGGFRWQGSQYIDEDNVFKLDETLTLNARAFYKYAQWQFGLNIKNITDEKYYYRGFGSSSVIPANPRSINIQLEFSI